MMIDCEISASRELSTLATVTLPSNCNFQDPLGAGAEVDRGSPDMRELSGEDVFTVSSGVLQISPQPQSMDPKQNWGEESSKFEFLSLHLQYRFGWSNFSAVRNIPSFDCVLYNNATRTTVASKRNCETFVDLKRQEAL